MDETDTKFQQKKRFDKIQSVYSRCLINRKIVLPMNSVGKNLNETIEENIKSLFEGKCVVEGYVKPDSSKIIRFSSGTIERGNTILFEVIFECDICFPVEGMIISCIVKNITKAGIKAASAYEKPSPIIVFIAKDHHYNIQQFSEVKEDDIISVRVIGQRFELNDKYVSIIGELLKDKPAFSNKPYDKNKSYDKKKFKPKSKPLLIIEE